VKARDPQSSTHPGVDSTSRLLRLVDRSGPPHRPVDGLLSRWYAASGSSVPYAEWSDPATAALLAAFDGASDVADVEVAVVAFAQARAGASHPVDAMADDLVALVRVAWPAGRGTWGEHLDPVALMARAVSAWTVEHAASSLSAVCIDDVTGLVSAGYVRERVRELHDQCRGLAISPPVTFGAVVVQLGFGFVVAAERITVRVAVCRRLADRFRSGETVGVVGPSRLVVLMPAYGIEHAIEHVRSDLADLAAIDEVEVVVRRLSFSEDHATTFRSLAGASVGS
jgi:hypothetical protein